MADFNYSDGYEPGQAENGKFWPISQSLLSTLGYPSTGMGKFAVITYQMGQSSTPATSASSGTLDSTYMMTSTYPASTVNVVTPPSPINSLEIYNNSANAVYISFPLFATYSDLKTYAVILNAGGFYQIDRYITSFSVGADLSTNLRIMGHYKS